MKKSTKLSAFTLIELLIVIAIIGILAGLMSGAIGNVMGGANATKIGNNGRNIINALMQANQDREAAAQSSLWPKTGGTVLKQKFANANEYFGILMEEEMLDGISLPDFAGASVIAAKSVDELKTEKKNIWSVLAGGKSSYTPIFWTRNLNLQQGDEKEFESADADKQVNWGRGNDAKLSANTTPFKDELAVIIRRGGAMQVLKAKQLTDYTFLAGSTNTADSIKIFHALGTGEDSEQEEE